MAHLSDEHLKAAQAVVERVGAYQETAPDRDTAKELRDGMEEAGVALSDGDLATLVDAIDDRGVVDVAEVLG
ncbi:hypothetical protein BHE97_00825 [Aeromicrobium sp. PE09-221]|uniref:hypothetical protein n=1 Tax=Aeromicrobium sp. PE09-221 TaxID=1898043 RepID=UPI000B3E50F2|nr:hypothetical protein [Aeromicrobium sp. PE09-221]OUZ12787.1 hypothetical protein BHE97_00825 [Aeromicrobium sp. PE09-221]